MKKNIIYCVYCGEKNNTMDKKCIKCSKKLNPKENLFLDYLQEHIKDDLKGKVENKVFSIIKNFIISHLYGTILTATLIFTVTSAVVFGIKNNSNDIIKVTERPNIVASNKNKCKFKNTSDRILTCEENYILEDNKCIKEEKIEPKINYSCRENYYLSGNRCISNQTYEKIVEKECIAPEGENYLDTRVENGVCLVNVCAGWTDGTCSAGSFEEIEFTINEYCPADTTLIGNSCKKVTGVLTRYSCEEGKLENNKCVSKKEKEPELSCKEGYIYNSECDICVGE